MLVTFLLSMNFANRLNPVLSINERYYIMMGIDSAINNAKTESIQQLCQNREQLRSFVTAICLGMAIPNAT